MPFVSVKTALTTSIRTPFKVGLTHPAAAALGYFVFEARTDRTFQEFPVGQKDRFGRNLIELHRQTRELLEKQRRDLFHPGRSQAIGRAINRNDAQDLARWTEDGSSDRGGIGISFSARHDDTALSALFQLRFQSFPLLRPRPLGIVRSRLPQKLLSRLTIHVSQHDFST